MKSIKTYILHYKPLGERKKFLVSKLDSEFLNYEFIEEFDQEELSLEKIKQDYICSEKSWLDKLKYLDVEGLDSFRKLTNAEISLIYKHKKALEMISKSKSKCELILEDDAIPVARYQKKLKNIVDHDTSWDVLFIGLGMGKSFLKKKLKIRFLVPGLLYELPNPSTNCTEAILIKPEAAKKILSSFKDFTMPMDFEYAYLFKRLKLNVKISSTYIFFQGSKKYNYFKKDIFQTSLDR
jgi:GR25 family glycosyltransferase involved in LPS biosynthesis